MAGQSILLNLEEGSVLGGIVLLQTVRRQSFWDSGRSELRETLVHLVSDYAACI